MERFQVMSFEVWPQMGTTDTNVGIGHWRPGRKHCEARQHWIDESLVLKFTVVKCVFVNTCTKINTCWGNFFVEDVAPWM